MDGMLSAGKNLSDREQERLKTIRALYEQQKFMYDNKVHSVPDRIVSLSQPYLRPIVRGKARAPVEFGAKLDISVVGGFVRLEKQSFDSYNESTCLQEEIERYQRSTPSDINPSAIPFPKPCNAPVTIAFLPKISKNRLPFEKPLFKVH